MKLNQLYILVEARRNPLLNPKINSTQTLRKLYKNDSDPSSLFVTFTNVNKLGINPSTEFATPNGIYSYRLSYIMRGLLYDEDSLLTSRPFPDDIVQNVIVFRLVNSQNVHNIKDQITDDVLQKMKEMSKEQPHYSNMFRPLIHGGKSNRTFGNLWFDVYKYIKSDKFFTDEVDDEGWSKFPRTKFRHDLDLAEYSIEARVALKIFRMLGIDGFIDDGEGIIHENEPDQAVFFNNNILKIVDHLKDEGYKTTIRENLPVNTKEQIIYINNNVLINDQLPKNMRLYYRKKVDNWLNSHIVQVYNDVDFLSVYAHYSTTLANCEGLINSSIHLNDEQKDILCHHLDVLLRGYDMKEKIINRIKEQNP